MTVNSIELVWLAVKDLKKAIAFYTEVLGLQLCEIDEQNKWAELSSPRGGLILGLTEISSSNENYSHEVLPGDNAVIILTVDDLTAAIKHMTAKGMRLHGSLLEVPGHVKLQMFLDIDGNKLQLAERLS